MKKHLLTVFAMSAVTWACFALSIVVCRGEIAATIASARGINAVRLQTLNSAITGFPAKNSSPSCAVKVFPLYRNCSSNSALRARS
jgi:hypothetical protein